MFVDTLMGIYLYLAGKGASTQGPGKKTHHLHADLETLRGQGIAGAPDPVHPPGRTSCPTPCHLRGRQATLLALHSPAFPLCDYSPREGHHRFHHSWLGQSAVDLTQSATTLRETLSSPQGTGKWLPGQADAEGTSPLLRGD